MRAAQARLSHLTDHALARVNEAGKFRLHALPYNNNIAKLKRSKYKYKRNLQMQFAY
jgi:hypothetical protein